jgi:hypothetical protein
MTKRITKDNLFKPSIPKVETKGDITDRAAKSIMDAEAAKRREKTAKLRAQRLAVPREKA